MADQTTFIVLRFVNTTPSLASCTQCQRKFFTPNSYYNDPVVQSSTCIPNSISTTA
jgi:hypothetical protein